MADSDLSFPAGRLRAWQLGDAPRLVEAWNDPEIATWNQVPPTPTLVVAERWIEGWQQRFDQRRAIDFVLVPNGDESSDGEGLPVGEIGLSHFTELDDGTTGALVGYWLLPEARGRGLATEALRAVHRWAPTVGVSTLVARCDGENPASQAVADRAGFVLRRTTAEGVQHWFSPRASDIGA